MDVPSCTKRRMFLISRKATPSLHIDLETTSRAGHKSTNNILGYAIPFLDERMSDLDQCGGLVTSVP